ncbi:MAG: hypothetical protein H8E38_13885, partial [SAR324 cluster bacterium]|nr:hypothetical protein [SAR324 cluster bacterium]
MKKLYLLIVLDSMAVFRLSGCTTEAEPTQAEEPKAEEPKAEEPKAE